VDLLTTPPDAQASDEEPIAPTTDQDSEAVETTEELGPAEPETDTEPTEETEDDPTEPNRSL